MEFIINEKPVPVTMCLNMIVKNESKIITRLFDSVLPIIDCYCICDTGSTDNTIEVISEYFRSKNIPGKIVVEPFKNFSYNRNFSLLSCIGMSDYLLLLDADMVLEINNFDKTILNKYDVLYLLQGCESFHYQNVRIIKNSGLANYIGVTHEYIDYPSNKARYSFSKKELFIRDIGDGGSKQNKFERDIKLLLEEVNQNPNNPRCHFYLANSYHDTGKYDLAISMYKKRIALGGWKEEVWYSYYRIGLCFQKLDQIDNAIIYWMLGYDYYPERLEGIYEIIKHYRIISKHKLCDMFYKTAKSILDKNYNLDDYLFLGRDVYSNQIFYEYTIFSCYLGVKNINDEVVLVLNNSNDQGEVNNLLSNMKFYKFILGCEKKEVFDDTILYKINDEPVKFNSSSSCLIPYNNGYKMNIRFVNYIIDDNGSYLNCNKHIITINKLVDLDKNFNVLSEKWIDQEFNDRRYMGIEDIRIFNDVVTNQLLFIGTGFHKNEQIGIVSGIYDTMNFRFEGNEITKDFNNSYCEKNWVYVDFNSSTHIIYNWYPINIYKINNDTKKIDFVIEKQTPNIFSKIRGSTCGFKYKNSDNENYITEIWFVNHIVSYETPRHYYHIISVFDTHMNLLRYSAPFKFEGDSIEYCLSIIVEDERVLMNYSNWDRTTRIGIYDKKYIDSIVKYN